MGSTQYYVAQSLDGYIADPDGGLDWLTGHSGESAIEDSQPGEGSYERFYAEVGAVAMGSATYEFILAEAAGGWPYEGRPSWVFTSRRLPVIEGADVRFARGPVAPVHAELQAAAGERNVWIVGGGALASQFADQGLLDELLVTVVPVVRGAGIPMFASRLEQGLRLTGLRPFSSGMVELRYELVR